MSLESVLNHNGFLTNIPDAPDKPDLPTLVLDTSIGGYDHEPVRMLCANQCARDQQHPCGVEITLGELAYSDTWVQRVGEQIPWMVLSWGPHMHRLAFCCVSCLKQFVDERAARSEVHREEHTHG